MCAAKLRTKNGSTKFILFDGVQNKKSGQFQPLLGCFVNYYYVVFELQRYEKFLDGKKWEGSVVIDFDPFTEEGVFHFVTVGVDNIAFFLQALQGAVDSAGRIVARLQRLAR